MRRVEVWGGWGLTDDSLSPECVSVSVHEAETSETCGLKWKKGEFSGLCLQKYQQASVTDCLQDVSAMQLYMSSHSLGGKKKKTDPEALH